MIVLAHRPRHRGGAGHRAAVVSYNGLIRLKNRIEAAWAQIDVQLKRRYDLIPNLVETVKGYAAHERETLDAVITARNRAMSACGPPRPAEGDNMITQALGRLFALSEAYPDLKANQNFQAPAGRAGRHRGQDRLRAAVLQRQRLQVQRQDPVVPRRDLRQRDGLQAREYFEADDESRGPVQVEF